MDPVYVTGALVVAVYSMAEALKWRNQKKNGMNGGFSHEDRQRLSTLFAQHQQMDEDGTPLWYVPRSMLQLLRRQSETLGNILTELRSLNKTMGRLGRPCPRPSGVECPYEKD